MAGSLNVPQSLYPPPLIQSISTSILAASQHRVMVDDPVSQSQFLQHFVPSGPSDLGMAAVAHGRDTSSSAVAAAATTGGEPGPSGRREGELSRTGLSFSPLPATFEELCRIQTSTHVSTDPADPKAVVPVPTDGPARHATTTLSGQSQALSRAAFVPGGTAAVAQQQASSSTTPSWRSPKPKVSPSDFSGNMSACLGDMMEALMGGRQALSRAGLSGPAASTSRSLSSLSGGGGWGGAHQPSARGSPHPEAMASSLDSGSSWRDAGRGRGGAVSSSPLGWSSGKGVQHSGRSGRGGGYDRSATLPVLGSPALLAKTKLEPIMSSAVSLLVTWVTPLGATYVHCCCVVAMKF